jgi:hypothetical protein
MTRDHRIAVAFGAFLVTRNNDHHRRGGQQEGRNKPGKRRRFNRRPNDQARRSRDKDNKNRPPDHMVIGGEKINAFDLFCALYLGITRDGKFRTQRPADVAARFGLNAYELDMKTVEYGLDRQTMRECGFDMDMAKYDIRVAPEGISRRELAKPWFEELQEAIAKIRPEVAQSNDEPEAEVEAKPSTPPSVQVDLKSPIFDD